MNDHATFMGIQNDTDPTTMPTTKGFEFGTFLRINGQLVQVNNILRWPHGQPLFERLTQDLVRLNVPGLERKGIRVCKTPSGVQDVHDVLNKIKGLRRGQNAGHLPA